ncbi:MAG: hypothetical protein ACKO1N_03680 [Erythrobacter sp.]
MEKQRKGPREGNEVVQGEVVRLDYQRFRNKSFVDCTLIFSGGLPPVLMDCDFIESTFAFEGAAQNTVAFLAAFAGGGGDGQKFILSILGIPSDG